MKTKKLHAFLLLMISTICSAGIHRDAAGLSAAAKPVTFTENKGQLSDQSGKPRPDVLYYGSAGPLDYRFLRSGISYQLHKIVEWQKPEFRHKQHAGLKKFQRDSLPSVTDIYRIDLRWLNANHEAKIQHEGLQPGFSNYYLPSSPAGVHGVRTFSAIIYKNIYDHIDLHFYESDGSLKYDFLVAPGGDFRKIRLEIEGSGNISISKTGELIIQTPLGNIVEEAPKVYQKGRLLNSCWKLDGNVLCFDIQNADPDQRLIIDPAIRTWGTYYGGSSNDNNYFVSTDKQNNVYMTGSTLSGGANIIATSGAHQSTFSGGFEDAFLAKFNSSGQRVWATYYGDFSYDFGTGCIADTSGNVYLCGASNASSGTVIATPGSEQPLSGGLYDAFLVKFNSSGQRQWSTYCGGSGDDLAYGISIDNGANIYVTGFTDSQNSSQIATGGAHQTSGGGSNYDAFLGKYNTSGQRLWGTYYGAPGGDELGVSCNADLNGNVFICGFTDAHTSSAIATTGAHQPLFGGLEDAFLAKFDANGLRLWGTYYGGNGYDTGFSCASDQNGNVYLAGSASSGNGISTSGSHQAFLAGSTNAMLVKFNGNGQRIWGTYYGGNNTVYGNACAADISGNVILAGYCEGGSGTVIATPGSHQTAYGGGLSDAYIAKFSSGGLRQWGTFYGGILSEDTKACAVSSAGEIYLSGFTSSSNGIASQGSHQVSFGGLYDAFLVQFSDCGPVNTTSPVFMNICPNNSTTLSASSSSVINWYASATGTTVLFSGSNYQTPVLSAGNYSYYAEDGTCGSNSTRTQFVVNVSQPSIQVNSGSVCQGQSYTIIPSGASTYTVSGGSFVITPLSSGVYSVTGTHSIGGCVSSTPALCYVNVNPLPAISASASTNMVCQGDFVFFFASGGMSYTWSPNAIGGFTYPFASDVYTVTGTDYNGCSNTATVFVGVIPSPVVSIAGPTLVCIGSVNRYTASGASSYTWYSNGKNGYSTTYSVQIYGPSYIYVQGMNLTGCAADMFLNIDVKEGPKLNIKSTKNLICSGETATLTGSGASSYTWSNNQTGPKIIVKPDSTTWYFVIGSNGCTNIAVYTQSVEACLGTEEQKFPNGLQLFPNPGNGIYHLRSSETPSALRIYNSLAQVISEPEPSGLQTEINISEQPPGIYIAVVMSGEKRYVIKFLKE